MAIGSSGSEPGEPIPPHSPTPRYGVVWAPWREIGYQRDNPRPPRILQLEGRQISGYGQKHTGLVRSIATRQVSGYSQKFDGTLISIATRSLDGKEERAGNHQPHYSTTLREFVGSTLTPSHLSGDEEGNNWSVCFHYQ